MELCGHHLILYLYMKRLFFLFLLAAAWNASAQTVAPVLLPQYIQGTITPNTQRVPFVCRLKLSGLQPATSYHYLNQLVTAADPLATSGSGNMFIPSSAGGNVYTSKPDLATAGNYGTLTTDATGSYTGWFFSEPSGNARFTTGNYVYVSITLNDGAGGTTAATYLRTADSVKVINQGAAAPNGGVMLYNTQDVGVPTVQPKNIVLIWDNDSAIGRPVSGTFVEDDSTAASTNFFADYKTLVDGKAGQWGMIIPSALPNGIRRFEQFAFGSAASVGANIDADGVWGTLNTVNPASAVASISIENGLAPMNTKVSIDQATIARSLIAYPNPVADALTLALPDVACVLTVQDVTGRVLLRIAGISGTQTVAVSGLAAGVYHLSCITATGETLRGNIIKQ